MSTKRTVFYRFLIIVILPLLFGCKDTRFKLPDRELSQKMTEATFDHTGHIYANRKYYDGYTIAIAGDSLEWYDKPNQGGNRFAADVHKVESVKIKHSHESWRYLLPLGGLLGGAAAGYSYEYYAMNIALVEDKTRDFNVLTPIIAGAVGAGLGFLAATLLDPGVQEDVWVFKTDTPRK